MLGLDVRRSEAAWWLLAFTLGAILFWVFYSFVGTFVFGVFIYYATRPIYRRMRRRGVRPPSLAATVAIFTLALPFLLLLAYAVAIGLQELNVFLENLQERQANGGADGGTGDGTGDASAGGVDQISDILDPYFDIASAVNNPEQLLSDPEGLDLVTNLASDAQGYIGFVTTGLLHVFVMIAIAFYLLRDGHKLSRWFRTTFGDDRGVLAAYLRVVDRDFKNIFFGNILNAFLTGTIGAISYSLLNVYAPQGGAIPYAALVGLLAGAASLIPVVGMKLVYFPVAAFLFFRAATEEPTGVFWFPVLFVSVSFVIVDVIPDLVLRPYVSGRNLHVGSVMFAYIFGPLLFGWYGIFLGPMLLVLSVHFARLVLPELLNAERVQPYAVDPSHFETATDQPAETGTEDVPGGSPAGESDE
ncbi:AI-2E family transporter [Haloarchaeobius litoreus]|uniref:AI-2E family transporter n=1 Tax=Haloarchaeobius litoreus TaxID=755306 RepID=A0ABD6DIN3_9EURY|nr:AI-2E family transporter [Haloarchaeobius litoreus]